MALGLAVQSWGEFVKEKREGKVAGERAWNGGRERRENLGWRKGKVQEEVLWVL